VLWLPPQAVRTFEGRKFVVVQEGDGQRRVDVKIGIQSEDRVEIEEGLKEGQVAVAP
jgi:multidrug efflux pump subunit AcrA (membrane-fusion protein)